MCLYVSVCGFWGGLYIDKKILKSKRGVWEIRVANSQTQTQKTIHPNTNKPPELIDAVELFIALIN